MFTGALATVYGIWLIYAAGPNYLFMCALLYVVGVPVYWWARHARGEKAFSVIEALIGLGIVVAAAAAGYLMWTGAISAL
jgi:arginine:ornithine antiporter/lysine permease